MIIYKDIKAFYLGLGYWQLALKIRGEVLQFKLKLSLEDLIKRINYWYEGGYINDISRV